MDSSVSPQPLLNSPSLLTPQFSLQFLCTSSWFGAPSPSGESCDPGSHICPSCQHQGSLALPLQPGGSDSRGLARSPGEIPQSAEWEKGETYILLGGAQDKGQGVPSSPANMEWDRLSKNLRGPSLFERPGVRMIVSTPF